jgi:carbon monoxide dehydrogenase subunit G
MRLEQSFTVQAPVERVWDALIDVPRVAPCLPGAEVSEVGEDGSYHGTFSVKLGPTTASYRGTLKLAELDEAARRATMSARGTDKRGQGGASATIVSTLVPDGDATRVDVDTDFTITGRLARFGRGGMIEDVSKRLLREFAACLQTTLAGEAPAVAPADAAAQPPSAGAEAMASATQPAPRAQQPAAPLNGLELLRQVLGDRLRRLLARLRGLLGGRG